MWDKRVFRGNTYSAIVISKKNDTQYEAKPKPVLQTIRPQQETSTPFDNQRANIEIFTDELVETLTDKPPRYEYGSQTEPLPEPAVVRHKMPDKYGEDMYIILHSDKHKYGTTSYLTMITRWSHC